MCDGVNKEGEILICRCEEVTEQMVRQAVHDGALTIDAVKKRTRVGMGFCQGRTCLRLIARIISEETGQRVSDLLPPTFRPPVRPVKISLIAAEGEENEE